MDKPIHIFAENVDGKALDQFYSAMKEDYAVAGALMPDVHAGYSLPIGGVVATVGQIVPAWVGYDIGCGMCAIPTSWGSSHVTTKAREIYDNIVERVPVGFNHHSKPADWPEYENIPKTAKMKEIFERVDRRGGNGFNQLGTLGGGNHFIEVGKEMGTGRVWVIIHSGSRGIGHAVGTHHMKVAGGGKAREGHYPLPLMSDEGMAYHSDMNFCLEFALENRRQMLREIETAMKNALGSGGFLWSEMINRNHNHAVEKDGMMIHRKGATHAEEGMMGVIPGNMRDGSFIVRGKGNKDGLWSSSHGAGRVLGRKAAKEKLSVDEFRTTMKGIVSRTNKDTLDESPMAYKDIFEVMEMQEDLVETICHIKPILNVKG